MCSNRASYYDEEAVPLLGSFESSPFDNKHIRNGFIQKVYGILAFMLTVTFAIVYFMRFNQAAHKWFASNRLLILVACIVYIVTAIMLILYSDTLGRTVPWNYMFLGLFTFSTAIIIAGACLRLNASIVLISLGITCIIVFTVSLFSCSTTFDFTKCIWIITMIFWIILLFICTAAFYDTTYGKVPLMQLTVGALSVTVFTIFLAIYTQILLSDEFELSPEDYIFAVLSLYVGIINIFLNLIKVVNKSNR